MKYKTGDYIKYPTPRGYFIAKITWAGKDGLRDKKIRFNILNPKPEDYTYTINNWFLRSYGIWKRCKIITANEAMVELL